MHIRPATTNDITDIAILGKQIFKQHLEFDNLYYEYSENFDTLFRDWIKVTLLSPEQFIFVAEDTDTGKISGFISGFVKLLYPWFKLKSVGHISYLIIDQKQRGKGVGKSLEETALNWFKEKNIRYIELYVEEKNETGLSAWYSYGYKPFKKFLRKII